jgi:hypothetical protein
MLFRCLPSSDHPLIEAIRQNNPIFGGAVIVFSSRDIAATAGEVELCYAGIIGLPALPSQPDKIAGDTSLP